jgi:single-strand DNA-binding protein
MNSVKLVGNVGQEVNIRNFDTSKLASFSLATKETYENKQNEEVSSTQWHNIVAWGKVADQCEKLIAKGKFVSIEGKLQTRHYLNKENKKVYITEVLAMKIDEVITKQKTKTFFL